MCLLKSEDEDNTRKQAVTSVMLNNLYPRLFCVTGLKMCYVSACGIFENVFNSYPIT